MLVVVVILLRRRNVPGALPLALLSIALTVYTLGYIGELGSTNVADVLTWLKLEYIGVVCLGPFIFLTILDFSGGRRYLSAFMLTLLFAVPFATLMLAWTAEYHDWMWQDLHLVQFGNLYLAEFTPGLWYWVDSLYTITLILASLVIMLLAFRRASDRFYRRQIITMSVGVILPIFVYLVYLLGIFDVGIDLNPFAGVLTATITAWALLKQQLFDVAPVAREILLAGIQDIVIVTDMRERVIDLNQAARQALNVTEQAVAGQPVETVFASWPPLVALYRDATKISEEIELNVRGRLCSYNVRITPLLDQSRRPRGRLITLTDITAKLQAERALQANYERMLTLRKIDFTLSKRLDAQYVADVTVKAALMVSKAKAVALLTLEDGQLRVLHATDQVPQELIGKMLTESHPALMSAIQERRFKFTIDQQIPSPQMLVPTMKVQAAVPLVSSQKDIGVLVLESDHSDLLSEEDIRMVKLLGVRAAVAIDNADMYEERERLVNELEAFAHTVAHDLKNPMSLIIGCTELLKDEQDRVMQLEFISMIDKSANKAVGIIDALLLLAGMRRSDRVEMTPLDMNAIVQEVLLRLDTLIKQYHAEIHLPDTWAQAVGYAPWVEEIWANYISNAIKYGGTPPVLHLNSHKLPDGRVFFWVEDNGTGLTSEQQSQLFQPFIRLTQARVEGHGLGLSIVQRIAERLGGSVGVNSAIGQGSRFYFTLSSSPLMHHDKSKSDIAS